MKVIGFNLLKGQLRYSVLEGTKDSPKLIEKHKYEVPDMPTPETMDWFESTFESLIEKVNPDKIAYRLSLEPNKAQIFYLLYPYAILNLICFKKNLPINVYTARNFVPSKLGLDKNKDIYDYCDEVFRKNPPHWDKNQKYSILSAWLEM